MESRPHVHTIERQIADTNVMAELSGLHRPKDVNNMQFARLERLPGLSQR